MTKAPQTALKGRESFHIAFKYKLNDHLLQMLQHDFSILEEYQLDDLQGQSYIFIARKKANSKRGG